MPKIVYLDDDRVQHILMKKLMKIHLPEWTSEFFSNPQDLTNWLAENQTDLILSDLNLENVSAWDWVEKFVESSNAEIVFLTAYASSEDKVKSSQFEQVRLIFEKPLSEENWKTIRELVAL